MIISCSDLLNSIGLFLDIIGVIILWRFGLPETINRKGYSYMVREEIDEEQIKRVKKYDKYSFVGLCILITGFVFQIVSNFI